MVFFTKIIGLFSSVKTWIYIVLGVVLIGGVGGTYLYIQYLQNERDSLKTQLNTIVAVYEENVKEFEKQQKNHALVLESIEKAHKQELDKQKKLISIKEEIKNVKKSDDDIIAPILINTLKRLQ